MANNLNIYEYLNFVNQERFNCIYLIYLSNIGQKGETVYKFGRTHDFFHRFYGYTKNSTLIFLCRVKDCHFVEDEIYKLFLKCFTHRTDYGREYFETDDVNKMIYSLNALIDHMSQRMDDNMVDKIKDHYKNWLKFKVHDYSVLSDNFTNELIEDYSDDKTDYTQKQKREKKEEYEFTQKMIQIKNFDVQQVIKSEDIDNLSYNEYMKDCTSVTLTEKQQYEIEKYMYKKYWNVDIVDKAFMDNWFRKTHVLDNIKYLLNIKDVNDIDQIITFDKHNYDNNTMYGKDKQKERIDLVNELIIIMGFDLENIGNNLVLSREAFNNNIKLCFEKCRIFTNIDSKKCISLFNVNMKKVDSIKAFMGSVNSLLKNWGLCIVSHKKTARVKKSNKFTLNLNYYLNYYQDIDQYL